MPDVDDVIKRSLENVHARIARMNRVTYLAGNLRPEELEGLIVFLEAALEERRPLAGLTRTVADEGLAYMLPAGAF